MTAPPGPDSHQPNARLTELFIASLKIGCLSFGGPAAQIAMMHRVFVDEKKWIDEPRYLHALNYCMLLPGPEAQQLATYVGWLLHGVKGGLIAGALFVVPGALVVLALSWLYLAHGSAPVVEAAFFGVRAAVVAFVIEALIRISKRALKRRADLWIAVASFAALTLFAVPFPVIIIAAALVGAFILQRSAPAILPVAAVAPPSTVKALQAAAVWAFAWLAPLGATVAALGPDHVVSRVGILFAKLAVVTFGGAYAVLSYLRQQAVEVEGWISPAQMIDGLGLAETTPGPLVLVNQFVGYVAGWQADGGGLVVALLAAAMASWMTFAPSFLWIFAGAPYAERVRQNAKASAALAAITAAVLGVIANLAFWFAVHVLFRETSTVTLLWGARIDLPQLESFDAIALAISAATAIALIRFHMNAIVVVVAAGLAGIALKSLG
ncbi:MAG: chromate efflux transporter [Parvularculaceae bacterium]